MQAFYERVDTSSLLDNFFRKQAFKLSFTISLIFVRESISDRAPKTPPYPGLRNFINGFD